MWLTLYWCWLSIKRLYYSDLWERVTVCPVPGLLMNTPLYTWSCIAGLQFALGVVDEFFFCSPNVTTLTGLASNASAANGTENCLDS